MFILSTIYRGLEFWSVSHTSIYENSELKVFENLGLKYLIIDQMIYYEQMYRRPDSWILLIIDVSDITMY